MYRPGISGLPASASIRRMMFQPVSRSAFFAGLKRTPARMNSSAMLPAPEPMRANIASSATPAGLIFHRLDMVHISSASIGTVQPSPSFGRSVFAVASSSIRIKLSLGYPLCQTSCRPNRTKNLGAALKDRNGTIRTNIQRQSGGTFTSTKQHLFGGCCTRSWGWRGDSAALER